VGLREERIGKNESLFREVNERIRDITTYDDAAEFLCECGDATCTDAIRMTIAEYEGVRRDATHFAVVAGHEIDDVEQVILQNERFAVVEKRAGDATKIALELNPRS
jgi:hypothetical protein